MIAFVIAAALTNAPLPSPNAVAVPPITFCFTVKAQNAAGFSPPSNMISISNPTNDQYGFCWSRSATATNYVLYVATNATDDPLSVQPYGNVTNAIWPVAYSNSVITVGCKGTGSLYASASIIGPWFLIRSNFTGVFRSWTNTIPMPAVQFWKGPGMYITRTNYN